MNIKSKISPEIINYVESKIFPEYAKNDAGHNLDHIKTVIMRSFELCENMGLELDSNYIYVIAAYHDLGKYISHEAHEKIAAQQFLSDEFMQNIFTIEERKIISEAIEDHRSSLSDSPRSEYGKLISSADRNTSIETTFKRSYEVGKWRNPDQSVRDFLSFTFNRLGKRYSIDNPENIFYIDSTYKNYISSIRELLQDEIRFNKMYCEVNMIDDNELDLSLVQSGKRKVKK